MNEPKEYIELRFVDSDLLSLPIFSHYPDGKAIVRQRGMTDEKWRDVKRAFFAPYPEMEIRDEWGKVIGKVGELWTLT